MSFSLVEVVSSVQGATHLVVVSGEIDMSSVDKARRAIDLALDQRPETLVLDLSGVTFCDSSGIHLVVTTNRRALAQAARLVVVRPSGPAWRAFEICHVDRELPFVSSHVTPLDGVDAAGEPDPAVASGP